jgi:hypothetical protein
MDRLEELEKALKEYKEMLEKGMAGMAQNLTGMPAGTAGGASMPNTTFDVEKKKEDKKMIEEKLDEHNEEKHGEAKHVDSAKKSEYKEVMKYDANGQWSLEKMGPLAGAVAGGIASGVAGSVTDSLMDKGEDKELEKAKADDIHNKPKRKGDEFRDRKWSIDTRTAEEKEIDEFNENSPTKTYKPGQRGFPKREKETKQTHDKKLAESGGKKGIKIKAVSRSNQKMND